MSYFISSNDLKVKFVRWLMQSPQVERMVVNAVLDSGGFDSAVERESERTVNNAIDELERQRERDGVRADDVDGLDDVVDERIERYVGGREFNEVVVDLAQEGISADRISGLSKYIADELDDTVVDKLLMNLTTAEVEKLRQRLYPVPFNPPVHAQLLAQGYSHERHPESYEDAGDVENGPHLTGGPAFDEYTSHEDYIIVDHEGHFAHHAVRDHAMEAFFAAADQGAAQ